MYDVLRRYFPNMTPEFVTLYHFNKFYGEYNESISGIVEDNMMWEDERLSLIMLKSSLLFREELKTIKEFLTQKELNESRNRNPQPSSI